MEFLPLSYFPLKMGLERQHVDGPQVWNAEVRILLLVPTNPVTFGKGT